MLRKESCKIDCRRHAGGGIIKDEARERAAKIRGQGFAVNTAINRLSSATTTTTTTTTTIQQQQQHQQQHLRAPPKTLLSLAGTYPPTTAPVSPGALQRPSEGHQPRSERQKKLTAIGVALSGLRYHGQLRRRRLECLFCRRLLRPGLRGGQGLPSGRLLLRGSGDGLPGCLAGPGILACHRAQTARGARVRRATPPNDVCTTRSVAHSEIPVMPWRQRTNVR